MWLVKGLSTRKSADRQVAQGRPRNPLVRQRRSRYVVAWTDEAGKEGQGPASIAATRLGMAGGAGQRQERRGLARRD